MLRAVRQPPNRVPLSVAGGALLGALTLGCSSGETRPDSGVPWTSGLAGAAGSGAGAAGGGHAGQGGIGTGGFATGGATGGDLGWPFADDVPEPCPPNPPDTTGAAWVGWANVQHPPLLEAVAGQQTAPVYGRVYAEGLTPAPGAAAGFSAELAIGPYGTLPSPEGRCWTTIPAAFNVDVGNDDEYAAQPTPTSEGLFGLLYRFRPDGGSWRYGDLDGSDDGVIAMQAALLVVHESSPSSAPVVFATLNLRCRVDDWPARRPLVVAALARIRPDLVAFQEDCAELGGGAPQSDEIRAELAPYLQRGFETVRVATHVAGDGAESFEEGISVLSAHPIEAASVLDLPYVHFPRRAIGVDVTVRGISLRFYATHFDYGADATAARQQSAEAILADWPATRPAVLGGDLNSTPEEPGAGTLRGMVADLWHTANPRNEGLTMPATAPTRRIDFLLASSSLAPSVRGAKLLDENASGIWLSDHLGVAVSLAVGDGR